MAADPAGNNVAGKQPVDRLSDLPDSILHHHVLSLLDTQSALRTSVLSRRWRCCWKHVQVLNFRPVSSRDLSSFQKHVRELLKSRFHTVPVRAVTFDVSGDRRREIWKGSAKSFRKVAKYVAAASRHAAGLHQLSLVDHDENRWDMNVKDAVDVLVDASLHESLRALELERCRLLEVDLGCFRSLATLELRGCTLHEPFPDPFASLTSLAHLTLLDCVSYHPFVVAGPRLLELRIERTRFRGLCHVIAPRLRSLRFSGSLGRTLPELIIHPALDHANIRLSWCTAEEEDGAVVSLLRGLRNAESLELCLDKFRCGVWEQHQLPLNRIKALMEQEEPPPFTRLRSLRLRCGYQQEWPPSVGDEVIRYFFGGSSDVEETLSQVGMVADYTKRD